MEIISLSGFLSKYELNNMISDLDIDETNLSGITTLQEYIDDEQSVNKEGVFCAYSEKEIFEYEYILIEENEFLNELLHEVKCLLSALIKNCSSCDLEKIPYTQQYDDPFNLNTVYDLLSSHSVPQIFISRIGSLKCSCGNDVYQDDPYLEEGELDDWIGEEINFIIDTFGIDLDAAVEFIEFLKMNPMMALYHPIGILISDKIQSREIIGVDIIKKNSTFYRGRKRKFHERRVPFIKEELWNPEVGLPSQGRYNPPGVSNLYLANNIEVVKQEINLGINELVDIAEFHINKDLLVFNTTVTDIDIFANMQKQDDLSFNPEYIFTNFLAQCLAYHGYHGVIYESVKINQGMNVCLFNVEPIKDLDIHYIQESVGKSESESNYDRTSVF
ncbi:RES family NAD+ phosphorylase [Shouchella sp. JSM 1781072]|uniref:RES family NAD+ phosphorylase n=1 Tax=Shouchella sp. JSM 1781072 TaxID=3344581 RepID=UPI0035C18CCF